MLNTKQQRGNYCNEKSMGHNRGDNDLFSDCTILYIGGGMRIKRTNRENGSEDFVTLEYAVDKLARHNFNTPDKHHKANMRETLERGATMSTCSYLYEKEK